MKIKDFAEVRGVEVNTIHQYMLRHGVEFEGHTRKEGKTIILDDVAVEMLAKVYPLPKPIEVIEDKESRLALLAAQQRIIELQQQFQQTAIALEARENKIALLEDRSKDKDADLERQRKELDELRAKLEAEQAARLASETALAAEKAEKEVVKTMGFWSFRKWRKSKGKEARNEEDN